MQILLSRSRTKARSLRAPAAALIALIMCSGLAFTGGMANNLSVVRPELKQEQSKKLDERLNAANSKFAVKLYEQARKQPGRTKVPIPPTSVVPALATPVN